MYARCGALLKAVQWSIDVKSLSREQNCCTGVEVYRWCLSRLSISGHCTGPGCNGTAPCKHPMHRNFHLEFYIQVNNNLTFKLQAAERAHKRRSGLYWQQTAVTRQQRKQQSRARVQLRARGANAKPFCSTSSEKRTTDHHKAHLGFVQ